MTVNVKVDVLDISGSPSSTASTAFTSTGGTADTGTKILYPYADTVLPLGLLPPLLQWSYGSAGVATAVKVTLRYPATGAALFSWARERPRESDPLPQSATNSSPCRESARRNPERGGRRSSKPPRAKPAIVCCA